MAGVQELVRNHSAVTLKAPLAEFRDAAVPEAEAEFLRLFPRSVRDARSGQSSLSWAAPSPVAGCVAVKTPEALAQLWMEHGGAIADVPAVNFEKSMVLAVFAGEGFFREVPSIDRVKVVANEVLVYVSRFSRPWSKHNAKAMVEVPQTDLPVRFVYLS